MQVKVSYGKENVPLVLWSELFELTQYIRHRRSHVRVILYT